MDVISGPPNFDRLAHVYRWMEYFSFGKMLEQCRFIFLRECCGRNRALILGDGDGRFTARLLADNPTLLADAVDCSRAMLTQLERRVGNATKISTPHLQTAESRLRTICTDIRAFFPPADCYDLVVSHFFLDCLTTLEVEELVERTLPKLAPNTLWLISEFSIPRNGWQRTAARLLIRWLYFAFRKMTNLQVRNIPDYSSVLLRHGFRQLRISRSFYGILSAELWERKIL